MEERKNANVFSYLDFFSCDGNFKFPWKNIQNIKKTFRRHFENVKYSLVDYLADEQNKQNIIMGIKPSSKTLHQNYAKKKSYLNSS